MTTEETPPAWRLVKSADNRVRLLIAKRDFTGDFDLGPFDEACERLVGFLTEWDYGERMK